MNSIRIAVLAAIMALSAQAALARPALWAFVGSTRMSEQDCVQTLLRACSREAKGCKAARNTIQYTDSDKVVWMICHPVTSAGIVVFSVSGATTGDSDDLKKILQAIKNYVDQKM